MAKISEMKWTSVNECLPEYSFNPLLIAWEDEFARFNTKYGFYLATGYYIEDKWHSHTGHILNRDGIIAGVSIPLELPTS